MAPHEPSTESVVRRCSCRRHKSHETEDLPTISHHFFHDRLLNPKPLDEDRPCLHEALCFSRKLGKKPLRFSKEKWHLYGIEGRHGSFLQEWDGPPGQDMAHAGLCRKSAQRAECMFCTVVVRVPDNNFDPLTRHKEMSPNCRYLRMIREHGTRPAADGARGRRRRSCSSFEILTRETEDIES